MEKDRGFRAMAIIAIIVSIAGLSVGFASLNQSLGINSIAKLKGTEWSVVFEGPATTNATGDATATANFDSDSTLLTVNAELKKPGDKVEISFKVKNAGGINAKLSTVPVFAGDTALATAANVNYSLTYSNKDTLKEGDLLNTEASRDLVLTIEFDSQATDVVEADTSFNLTLALLYIQN